MLAPNLEVIDRLKRQMQSRYGVAPEKVRVVKAPYRICPLGAHIDHQLGWVTAMTIDQAVFLAYAPSGSREMRLSSLAFDGLVRFHLDQIPPRLQGDWGNYARGAAMALNQAQPLTQGLVGITAGRLGEGGLSSSSSIGVAYLTALADVNGLHYSAAELIRLDQAIENGYLGLNNGILDQSAILLSRQGCLTLINCQAFAESPERRNEPGLPPGIRLIAHAPSMPPFAILIAFSGVSQPLVGTAYNSRVRECAEAAAVLLKAAGRDQPRPKLAHVTLQEFEAHRALLTGPLARRAEHFFSEMQRVRQGVQAWQDGQLETFGQLVTESGWSSIRNYECGSPPLIDLFQILIRTAGVYGARFSGAGFRGCCVALVDPPTARQLVPQIQAAYAARQPELAKAASILLCQPDDGVCFL